MLLDMLWFIYRFSKILQHECVKWGEVYAGDLWKKTQHLSWKCYPRVLIHFPLFCKLTKRRVYTVGFFSIICLCIYAMGFCLCFCFCSFIFLETSAVQVLACTNQHPGMQGLVWTNNNSISLLFVSSVMARCVPLALWLQCFCPDACFLVLHSESTWSIDLGNMLSFYSKPFILTISRWKL